MSKSQEADEIFGCLMMFVGIGLAFAFLAFIFVPVLDGDAPKWKVWAFIVGMVLYGLVGGLGKAFEAGFSSKTLLDFFGKRREPVVDKTNQQEEDSDSKP